MKFNRYEELRRNSLKLAKYRMACRMFHDLGIDQILLDLGKSVDVASTALDAGVAIVDVCALEHQRTLGYQECLDKLFSLDEQIPGEENLPSPDFGALQKMIDDGFCTKEEAEQFSLGDFEQ